MSAMSTSTSFLTCPTSCSCCCARSRPAVFSPPPLLLLLLLLPQRRPVSVLQRRGAPLLRWPRRSPTTRRTSRPSGPSVPPKIPRRRARPRPRADCRFPGHARLFGCGGRGGPRSMARRPSPIRTLLPLMSLPGMVPCAVDAPPARARQAHARALRWAAPVQISLGGGMPNPALFPVTGVTFDLQDGSQLRLDPELVKTALQYSPTVRRPPFPAAPHRTQPAPLTASTCARHWLGARSAGPAAARGLAHNPAAAGPRAHPRRVRRHGHHRQPGRALHGTGPALHAGSVTRRGLTPRHGALFPTSDQAFQMLIDSGDHILVETPTYSGSLAALRPLGCHMHGTPRRGTRAGDCC